ncbi:hypothetical protein Acr_23g0006700 [Actinidia rufa]|uniref:Uncharacterized protein n=1 Tax=Actinidia rufa TaxID=165716 RepID=A0A7J0GNC2_9ERIC|nr:hypothetical protein Acr_23g0006700 [Actinidia rufa]
MWSRGRGERESVRHKLSPLQNIDFFASKERIPAKKKQGSNDLMASSNSAHLLLKFIFLLHHCVTKTVKI